MKNPKNTGNRILQAIHTKEVCKIMESVFFLSFALLVINGVLPERGPSDYIPKSISEPVFINTLDSVGEGDVFVLSSAATAPAPQVSAQSAALLCADTGELIYGKNSNELLPMASTTKIMTALVVLEKLPLDSIFTVPPEACSVEGSSIYLYPGEEITIRDLLYGLLLESGNDAATALALACSGSVEEFVSEMNKKAHELGLSCTGFANPHGLSAKGHYTTAYELARLTYFAMQNPTFREMCSSKNYSVQNPDGSPSHYFVNHNKLLRTYSGAIGVKTGYTIASGRCLVSCAEREDSTYIVVTLNDRNDWKDHTALLDYAFSHYRSVTFFEKGELSFVFGEKTFSNKEPLSVLVARGKTELEFSAELK